jgi:hypothetical protein
MKAFLLEFSSCNLLKPVIQSHYKFGVQLFILGALPRMIKLPRIEISSL